MAEIATIARPYAEALYKSAQADLTGGGSSWLDALASVAADGQLTSFADNPKATPQQVYDIVSEVARVQLPRIGTGISLIASPGLAIVTTLR